MTTTTAPHHPSRADLQRKLRKCWIQTIVAVERTHRVRLPFEQVHRAFANMADDWSGYSERC